MTVWIVISIIALVLSPLAWLKPSRHQGVRMNARMAARRLGLSMQLAPQQWPHWLEREAPDPCAQYCRPRQAKSVDTFAYWQKADGQWFNQWREPCCDERVMAQLQRLPRDAYKLEAGPQLIALYWGERGDDAQVAVIDEVLKALA